MQQRPQRVLEFNAAQIRHHFLRWPLSVFRSFWFCHDFAFCPTEYAGLSVSPDNQIAGKVYSFKSTADTLNACR
jgi:hypothetical protein